MPPTNLWNRLRRKPAKDELRKKSVKDDLRYSRLEASGPSAEPQPVNINSPPVPAKDTLYPGPEPTSGIGTVDSSWSGTGFENHHATEQPAEIPPGPKQRPLTTENFTPPDDIRPAENPVDRKSLWSEYTVGIDLGTTYSCVGIFRNGKIEIIPNERGDHTTPSCVAFTDNGRLIGAPAKGQIAFNPLDTVFDVKRLIGRRYDDPVIRVEQKRLPFRIVDRSGRPAVEVDFKGDKKEFTPEEISAMVLSKLKGMAVSHLGLKPGSDLGCVITVPSTFNIYQRQSTKNACAIAGLDVHRIISEPTAAAFAYDLVRKRDPGPEKERWGLIFDLGGGTLGVSLLAFEDGIAEVKNTAGDDHLGGEDFDYRLMIYLAKFFDTKHQTNIMSDARAVSRLRTSAERAKRVLSSSMQTSIEIESLHSGHDFRTNVTREEFEECCSDLFEGVTTALSQVLKFRSYTVEKRSIDEVVMVGGSSRIPKIQEIVSRFFDGKELNKSINPDEAATFGAAVFAATITNGDPSLNERLLLDATSMSIHVKSGSDKHGSQLVCKNTTIPISKLQTFTTDSDNQKSIRFSFYEGERKNLEENLLLSELELSGLEPAPKGVPQIDVSADLSHDYTIRFTLEDRANGNKVTTIVDRAINPLGEGDIRRMRAEAQSMNHQDSVDSERFLLKNTLESTAYAIEDSFNNLKLQGSISSYHEEQIIAGVEKILAWLESNQQAPRSEYRSKLEQLEIFSGLATRLTETSKISTRDSDQGASVPIFNDTAVNTTPSQRNRDSSQRADLDRLSSPSIQIPINLVATPTKAKAPEVLRSSANPERNLLDHEAPHDTIKDRSLSVDQSDLSLTAHNPILLPNTASSASSRRPPTPEELTASMMSIENRLGNFFLDIELSEQKCYSDQDLQDISILLRNMGRESWSQVPRIYTVLRRINELPLLDDFIELGITDFFFPFTISSLPGKLSPSVRTRFVDTQHCVLTIALELEKGSEHRHAHFGSGQLLPFEVTARLGQGGYGTVDKVISLLSHREYARKTFRRKKTFSKEKEDIKSFKAELKILKRLRHMHCVELVGSYTDPKYLALIMSPVADCNLATYYTLAASSEDKMSLLRSFFGCLANALQYLHHSKIRHRDIKPENILIKGSNVLLADFGLSFDWEHLSRSTTTADSAKTPLYAAPEVAFFERRKNSSSDIWSLGCVFLEMVTVLKGHPVSAMRNFFKERNDNYRYYDNTEAVKEWTRRLSGIGSSDDTISVKWITDMLQKEHDKRPTASSLFRHIVDSEVKGRFCGPCCHGDDDTDDSDENSDGHDIWADTEEEPKSDADVEVTSVLDVVIEE